MVDTIKVSQLIQKTDPWFGRCININSFNRLKSH